MLEKAKTLTRQCETIHEQQVIMNSGSSGQPSQVDALKHKGTSNTDSRRNQTVAERTANAAGQAKKCSRCGRGTVEMRVQPRM